MSVVVYGANGHGKVVCDVLLEAGLEVLGFVDDDVKTHGRTVLGLPVLGGGEWLEGKRASVALGIGDNAVRELVARACLERGASLVTCVHPRAHVARSARLGEGTIVMAMVAINPDAVIGRGVIVNTGVIVEHDNVIGDFAHLSPNVALGGEVTVGEFAHLGVGASVRPRSRIGARATVGAGSVVIGDVGAGAVAYGVPARAR